MRTFLGFVLAFLLGCSAGPAPDTTGGPAFDADKLAAIGPHMQQRITEGRMIGGFGLIAKDGETVYFEAWGQRDRENDLPMTKDTVVRLFSMTKPIVSVGIMSLIEEDKLALEDPVSKYIPELGGLEVWADGKRIPAEHDITIQDLLTHTSGLTYGFFADHPVDALYREAATHKTADLGALMKILGTLPLKFQPGTKWNYGYSTDVLGRVIEVVSDKKLDAFLAERIFDPLGMTETGFYTKPGAVDRLARIYTPDEEDKLVVATDEIVAASGRRVRDYTRPTTFLSGGGGLAGTPGDYLRFAEIFLNGGGGIISQESIDRMLTNHQPEPDQHFGLGMSIEDAPDGESKIYGWGGAAGHAFLGGRRPQDDHDGRAAALSRRRKAKDGVAESVLGGGLRGVERGVMGGRIPCAWRRKAARHSRTPRDERRPEVHRRASSVTFVLSSLPSRMYWISTVWPTSLSRRA